MPVHTSGARIRAIIRGAPAYIPPTVLTARFYGDLLPVGVGRAYVGTADPLNSDPSSMEPPVVGIRRSYWGARSTWGIDTATPAAGTLAATVAADAGAGRLPAVSVRAQQYTPAGGVVTGYYGMTATQASAQSGDFLALARWAAAQKYASGPLAGVPMAILVSVDHSPETQIPTGGSETQALADYAAASQRLADAIVLAGATNLTQVDILAAPTMLAATGRNSSGWIAASKGKILGLDYYAAATSPTSWTTLTGTSRLAEITTVVESSRKPILLAEVGQTQWLADSNTQAWNDQLAAMVSYVSSRGWVGMAYVNSAAPSGDYQDRPWTLTATQRALYAALRGQGFVRTVLDALASQTGTGGDQGGGGGGTTATPVYPGPAVYPSPSLFPQGT